MLEIKIAKIMFLNVLAPSDLKKIEPPSMKFIEKDIFATKRDKWK